MKKMLVPVATNYSLLMSTSVEAVSTCLLLLLLFLLQLPRGIVFVFFVFFFFFNFFYFIIVVVVVNVVFSVIVGVAIFVDGSGLDERSGEGTAMEPVGVVAALLLSGTAAHASRKTATMLSRNVRSRTATPRPHAPPSPCSAEDPHPPLPPPSHSAMLPTLLARTRAMRAASRSLAMRRAAVHTP